DGRWEAAYDGAKSMEVPVELAKALAKNRKARAFFDALDKTNRYAVCWRVQTAMRPETRLARIEKLVAMLARGEKIHDA
ncbi:MAG TPA: YdeI/OmpD-associated family protein, partial [Pseudoxanthomonas sp.]